VLVSASMFPILATTPSIKSGESKIEALLPTTWKMERLLPEVNEGYFFHGTKPEVVENVICQGLDIRMAGTALLGRAIYLAESSTKADQYTGFKIVLLTNTLLTIICYTKHLLYAPSKMLGLYLDILIIGHKFCNMLSILTLLL